MGNKLNFLIETDSDRPVTADFFCAETIEKQAPLVIFSHGYKGFKDWGHFPLMPPFFNAAGMNFMKFNFSHNGCPADSLTEFTDLEGFALNNFSREMQDLQCVLNWVLDNKNPFAQIIDPSRVYLFGHSRGGSISILTAEKDNRIKKLVTWSAVADFSKRLPNKDEIAKWKRDGVRFVMNSRTGQKMPHYYQFYENYVTNKKQFDIARAESSLTIPHLLIHGTKDETVYLGEAIHLMSQNEHTSLIKLHNATHTYGGYHPYLSEQLSTHAVAAINYTIAFLKNE